MTRAAVYCRISQDPKDIGENVATQRKRCLALAKAEGWEIVPDGTEDTFSDNDITGGKDEAGRPGFRRLTAAVLADKVDVIIASKTSRLARDVDIVSAFAKTCEDHVKLWRFLGGALREFVPGSSRTALLQAALSDEDYRTQVAADVKNAKTEDEANGVWRGGRVPYGYVQTVKADKDNGIKPALGINETTAERIRGWAKAVLDNRSLNAIADALSAEGVPTSTGRGRWASQTLRSILTNRLYLAEAPAQWEPILDAETFAAVGTILADPKRRPKKIGARYPLVGVLRCHCGARMVSRPTNKAGRSIRRYGCRTTGHGTVSADHAEAYAFNRIARLADLPRAGEIIRDAEGHQDEEAAALRVANAKDAAAVDDLYASVGDKYGTTVADIGPRVKVLKTAIAGREAQLAERAGRSALDRFAGRVGAEWETLDVEDQRAVILSLVRRVDVGPKVAMYGWHPERLQPAWRFSALAAIEWPEPTEADLRADNAEADEAERALRAGDAA